jgi:hypothetical protein
MNRVNTGTARTDRLDQTNIQICILKQIASIRIKYHYSPSIVWETLDCTKLQTLERYHKIKNITGLWKWILRTESDDQNSSSKTKF